MHVEFLVSLLPAQVMQVVEKNQKMVEFMIKTLSIFTILLFLTPSVLAQ
jgi:hypothetical protein